MRFCGPSIAIGCRREIRTAGETRCFGTTPPGTKLKLKPRPKPLTFTAPLLVIKNRFTAMEFAITARTKVPERPVHKGL